METYNVTQTSPAGLSATVSHLLSSNEAHLLSELLRALHSSGGWTFEVLRDAPERDYGDGGGLLFVQRAIAEALDLRKPERN